MVASLFNLTGSMNLTSCTLEIIPSPLLFSMLLDQILYQQSVDLKLINSFYVVNDLNILDKV